MHKHRAPFRGRLLPLPAAYFISGLGTIGEEGSIRLSAEGVPDPAARKDSLAELIGAAPLASAAMDNVESVEEAIEAR